MDQHEQNGFTWSVGFIGLLVANFGEKMIVKAAEEPEEVITTEEEIDDLEWDDTYLSNVEEKVPTPALDPPPQLLQPPAQPAMIPGHLQHLKGGSSSTKKTIIRLSKGHKPKPTDRIVYVSGAFDLFHIGHLAFLEEASKHGDYVIVGIHPDQLVNRHKGDEYPIMTLDERVMSVLASKFMHWRARMSKALRSSRTSKMAVRIYPPGRRVRRHLAPPPVVSQPVDEEVEPDPDHLNMLQKNPELLKKAIKILSSVGGLFLIYKVAKFLFS